MRFIETAVFTRTIVALLDDEEYRSVQLALFHRPESGALIPKSGGLRKLRWPLPGRGKRGGLRVIYFWDEASETFYMLFAYAKNEQEDLTAQQLRVLKASGSGGIRMKKQDFDQLVTAFAKQERYVAVWPNPAAFLNFLRSMSRQSGARQVAG